MSHGFDGDDDPLSVAPRAFQVDDGLSTPHLNDIMDRAMGKVKSMILELESDKGQIYYNLLLFILLHRYQRGKSRTFLMLELLKRYTR